MSILIGNTNYKDLSPVMTSNATPSPYVAECSIVVINALWQAFDGTMDTVFRTNIATTTPFIISLDYGEGNGQIINAYKLYCTYNTNWTMKSWNFEASNDNVTWDILDSRTDINWDINNVQDFVFSNFSEYRYYRFNVLEKNGTNSVCINQIKFLQEEISNIEFRKILKDNLPASKTDGIDTVYFTDDGKIYITDKNGNLVPTGVEQIKTLSSDECLKFVGDLWSENSEENTNDEQILVSDNNLMQIMNKNNEVINVKLDSLTMVATEKDCDKIIENVSKIIRRE